MKRFLLFFLLLIVSMLGGNYSLANTETSVGVAKRFLSDHVAEYSLKSDQSDLKFLNMTQSLTADHVKFQQFYKGIPIYRAYIMVHVSKEDEKGNQSVLFVNNHYDSSISLQNIVPVINSDIALSKAQNEVGTKGASPKIELVVYPQKTVALAWNISLVSNSPYENWEVFIDVITGKLLDKKLTKVYTGMGTNKDLEQIKSLPPTKNVGFFSSIIKAINEIFNWKSLFSD